MDFYHFWREVSKPSPTPNEVRESGGRVSFDMGVPTVGAPRKDYRVCWSDAPVTVGDPSSYKVEVSAASQLKGPNVEATEEDAIACTLGEECSLTVTGVDIATTSRNLVPGVTL